MVRICVGGMANGWFGVLAEECWEGRWALREKRRGEGLMEAVLENLKTAWFWDLGCWTWMC